MVMSKKKEEVLVENEEKKELEEIPVCGEQGGDIIGKGLLNDIINGTPISKVMLMLMKTVIPDLTSGSIVPKDAYYDEHKKATVIKMTVHAETDYEIEAMISIKKSWIVDLRIKNTATNMVRRFQYTETRTEDEEELI